MHSAERIKGIDVFVATAEAGSFTAAAERLHLSSSAVGKAVARLEARLGQRLFERSTRRLALTDAGTAFLQVCVRVLDELASAEKVLAAQSVEPSGRLRLDLPVTFGLRQVMPLLLAYTQLHPAVLPQVSFTDRFVDVIDEGIDLAVRIGGPDVWPADLGHACLGAERLVFCAAPAYLQRCGTPVSADELPGHELVMYGRAEGSPSPWRIARGEAAVERRMFDARIVVGNGQAQLDAVLAGCGIAQLATWLAGDALREGRLVQILPDWSVDGLPLNLVWPRSKRLLPKVSGLVAYLSDRLGVR
ncbi:LysR family transcriptional regulator [Xylophilus rhododendri]|uniref:LysR family transcriptional regulator n=1 Tax=Xylophilus rhododendri TaxID=2697032 RepID=A0A857JCB7_9BURK|nr:LysR family transcriptional regulator [Xylophilus rhododendri]QHJ00379.1 LysR family transcriptional regulator [Xylophilus rhododendri]